MFEGIKEKATADCFWSCHKSTNQSRSKHKCCHKHLNAWQGNNHLWGFKWLNPWSSPESHSHTGVQCHIVTSAVFVGPNADWATATGQVCHLGISTSAKGCMGCIFNTNVSPGGMKPWTIANAANLLTLEPQGLTVCGTWASFLQGRTLFVTSWFLQNGSGALLSAAAARMRTWQCPGGPCRNCAFHPRIA